MSSLPIALQEILLATDFSEPARRALALAKHIARHRALPLRAVHVLDLTEYALTKSGAAGQVSFAAAHDSARRALREIRRELRLASVENTATLVSAGKPAAALRELARQHPPSLLILSVRSRPPTGLGSTARSLLAAPPCPILTVNERCPEISSASTLDRAVIVVDALPKSLHAALHAWPSGPRQSSPTIFAVRPRDIRPASEISGAPWHRFRPIILHDRAQAADAILRHATEAGAGLIITAFGNETLLSSLTRGALAHSLLTRAPCPVLTLPA